MRLGFAGLGHLGGPICDQLIAAGHEVTVHDPVGDAVAARVAAGARAVASAGEVASGASVVVVVVRDDAQAIAAVAGPDGIVQRGSAGTLVVLHSTVSLDTVRALQEASHARGLRFVDAGLTRGAPGGVADAAGRSLYAMCGGEPEDVAFAATVMEAYCCQVVRFGPVGSGMVAKLARNAVQYAIWAAIDEGMRIFEAAAIPLSSFAALYRDTGMPDLHEFLIDRVSTDDAIGRGAAPIDAEQLVALGLKDLTAALDVAERLQVRADLVAATARAWPAVVRSGP